MAQYVVAGAEAADALTQSVVGMADAAQHIQAVTTAMAAQNKENMRNEDNDFNIRNQFLQNAVNEIKRVTCSQFNIVICTNQEKDDFQNLKGQILPMNLLNLEIAPNKFVDFQIYVFDTGNYLRHGKYETNYWQYWGQSKKWYDPAAMHVDFNNAQKKLDPSQVQAANDAAKKTNATAAAANAASTAVQQTASVANAATVATQGTNPDGTPAAPPAASNGPYPSFMSREYLCSCSSSSSAASGAPIPSRTCYSRPAAAARSRKLTLFTRHGRPGYGASYADAGWSCSIASLTCLRIVSSAQGIDQTVHLRSDCSKAVS